MVETLSHTTGVWNHAFQLLAVQFLVLTPTRTVSQTSGNHVHTSPDVLTVSGHTDLYTDWINRR